MKSERVTIMVWAGEQELLALGKFASRVLFKDPYVLAVPATHRFAKRDGAMIADLQDEPFIVRPSRDKFKDASDAAGTLKQESAIKVRLPLAPPIKPKAFLPDPALSHDPLLARLDQKESSTANPRQA